ncbi:MAG: hypothetical protein AAF730_18425 [Bacteroidota bacterium]
MAASFRTALEVIASRVAGHRRPSGALAYGGSTTPEARPGVVTVCVLVSILTWFVFSLQRSYTTVVQIPALVVNLPDDEALRNPAPEAITVQVQGIGFEIIQLRSNPPTLQLDAADDQVVLDETLLNLPLNVTGISPRVVDFDKEQRATKVVPIRIDAAITLPPTFGYLIAPKAVPDSVRITGAASIVDGITVWPTERLTVDVLRDSVQTQVALVDTLSALVQREVNTVEVVAQAVEFTEGRRELEVRVEGTTLMGGRPTAELDPRSIIVRYRVPLQQYNAALKANDFFATVSFDEIRRDTTGRVTPRVRYPEGILIRDPVVEPPATLRYYNVLMDN